MKADEASVRRRQRRDRIATWVVRLGGVGVGRGGPVHGCLPDLGGGAARVRPPRSRRQSTSGRSRRGVAGGVEPYVEAVWILDADGALRLHDLRTTALLQEEQPLEFAEGERVTRATVPPAGGRVDFVTDAGRLGTIGFSTSFDYDEESRRVHRLDDLDARWLVEEPGAAIDAFAVLAYGGRTWFGWVA